VTAVSRDNAPLAGIGPGRTIEYLINYNLTGDETLARLVMDPLGQVEVQALAPAARPDSGGGFGFTFTFVVMFVLFFVITMSAGYMLQSVAKEKESRTAEILLVSLRPRELMLGKVIGLGAVALLQMAVWFGGGAAVGNSGAAALLASGQALPLSFVLWAVAYFLLGYLIYAALLGALGALAPTMREGSQFTFVMLLPLLVPLWLNSVFTQDPNGAAATILSLFPLTAPTAMVTRMAATVVPLWQPIVGLALLLVTAYLLVMLSARFFRADTLLSSDSLNWARIRRELRGA
jgi:ABC-2 type transport system permease protein